MWRFGPLMPFNISTDPDNVCTLGEGHTPIIDISNYPICNELNLQIYLKDEGQPYAGYGANPTGSFKDRGMSVVASMARHYGLTLLAVPTQSNAGDSLSEYGVANNLAVAVIMPDDTPMPIMGKVTGYSLQHAGISLEMVKGTIREAGTLMKQKYLPKGYFNCATFQEPGWRIEGKKPWGWNWLNPGQNSNPNGHYPTLYFTQLAGNRHPWHVEGFR
jgi:threonine synthase